MYKNERSSNTLPQRRRTASFSSSLLDAIYRSIDESNGVVVEVEADAEALSQYQETSMIKKHNSSASSSVSTIRRDAAFLEDEQELSNLRRAIMIESWMKKRSTRDGSLHSNSNSTSTSSDSSSAGRAGGGVFSSSEAESSVKEKSRKKHITDVQTKPKCEGEGGGGFTKTKLRALKLYGELKKAKQPISPGGRIANFLNSIFSSGSTKKVKMCSIGGMDDVSSDRRSKSACSSASSFSRSCLSKTTPPSRGKQSNGMGSSNNNNTNKRSVRFYPVSVIVDEDSRPCGHKCIYEDDPGLMPMPMPMPPRKISMSSSLKKDVAKGANYIRSYQKKNFSEFDLKGFYSYDGDSDDDDDDKSCSSSDLFELDHLIGVGRYREELPVYETTSLKTNQAIANGFIL